MVVLGRTAKIVLSSGALLLVLWITLLVFSASSIEESSSSSQPLKDAKQVSYLASRDVQENCKTTIVHFWCIALHRQEEEESARKGTRYPMEKSESQRAGHP